MRRLIEIKATGADVLDLSNPSFGSDDRFGVVMTALHQMENADKSRTVKTQTHRGVTMIRDNQAHYGPLPAFWKIRGARYGKQAYCDNLEAVRDIYRRAADNESLNSIGRRYDMFPEGVKNLLKFQANYTGVIDCHYNELRWQHKVTSLVDADLWYQANRTRRNPNRGGRKNTHWVSGVFDCPECGGMTYINAASDRRTKIRCAGFRKTRQACGIFKGCLAEPILDKLDEMFSASDTPLLAFQRIAGNSHELEELRQAISLQRATLADAADILAAAQEIATLEQAVKDFTVIPDDFDYAPTGKTLAGLWSDEANRNNMLKAIKRTMGLDFYPPDDVYVGVIPSETVTDGIVDLGGGVCFRLDTL
jgi:hypothetical protein